MCHLKSNKKDRTKPESMSSIKAIDASVLEGRLEGEGEKRGQTRMKEESEERKEQSKERTRKDKKKERGRVEDKCQTKEEEKSRKAEQGPWMLMGDGKGNSWERWET